MRNGRVKRGRKGRANVLYSTGLHCDCVLSSFLILICFLPLSLPLFQIGIPLTARILDLPRWHWRRQSKGFSSSQDLLRKSIKI
ncbi:hypothetical protein C4D60_Mb02t05960 [Musa balbisiana]|uniref:Uncharacterized protein n=1 Tax=Musa balbisiana TaxID=52838 RepID=A0A4S8I8K2_MUSBA|nr:hypothetical protein C4D60_Mb02t05960 [Musa balbisiana]